jgi:hypothetical protein
MSENGISLGSDGIDPSISEEDAQDVKLVLDLFKKYKHHRSKYDKNWLSYYKMWRGDQWHNVRMPSFRQKEVVNMIWQTIQSNMPMQTDVRPKISFIPEEPSDMAFAEVLNKISESDWERKNWLHVLSEVIIDGYLYGTGIGEIGFDPDDDYGIGSATFRSVDPFYCYPDPEAEDINDSKSFGFIIAEPVCTKRLKQKYPDKADKIKADIRDVIASSKTALNDFKLKSSNTDRDMPDITFMDGEDTADDKVLVITAYLKPQETNDEESMDESGDVKVITRKVYPNGRVIRIANGVKLEETELPFANGKFPFARYNNYILPREFYGVSEVEQLESPQRVFNKLLNASLEILNLMGNPIWIVDTASGVDPQHLVNRTGLVVEKEPGSEVRRETGVQLSPSSLSLIDRMETWFNNVAGTQDVSRGQTPGSVTAASAIEQLQEAARTRIRQKQRNLDGFIRDIGRQYSEIVLENYTKPRVFRITNNEGSTEFFKFRVERNERAGIPGPDGRMGPERIAYIQKFVAGQIDGNDTYVEDVPTRLALQAASFDVRVNTGSTLPFTTADREQKALNLFDRQVIDAEELLSIMDFPNREKILERMKQKEAMAAEQAALQGG